MHLKSTSSVHAHLESLEKKGILNGTRLKPRAIEICDKDFRTGRLDAIQSIQKVAENETASEPYIVQVPLIGKVAAGEPLLAVEHIDGYFPMPLDRLPNAETFLLKVQGESMVNAGILNGDYVLVEQQETASNGEMVVALLEDSATVKTFYREDGFLSAAAGKRLYGADYCGGRPADPRKGNRRASLYELTYIFRFCTMPAGNRIGNHSSGCRDARRRRRRNIL